MSPEWASGVRNSSTGSVGAGGTLALAARGAFALLAIETGYSAEIRYR